MKTINFKTIEDLANSEFKELATPEGSLSYLKGVYRGRVEDTPKVLLEVLYKNIPFYLDYLIYVYPLPRGTYGRGRFPSEGIIDEYLTHNFEKIVESKNSIHTNPRRNTESTPLYIFLKYSSLISTRSKAVEDLFKSIQYTPPVLRAFGEYVSTQTSPETFSEMSSLALDVYERVISTAAPYKDSIFNTILKLHNHSRVYERSEMKKITVDLRFITLLENKLRGSVSLSPTSHLGLVSNAVGLLNTFTISGARIKGQPWGAVEESLRVLLSSKKIKGTKTFLEYLIYNKPKEGKEYSEIINKLVKKTLIRFFSTATCFEDSPGLYFGEMSDFKDLFLSQNSTKREEIFNEWEDLILNKLKGRPKAASNLIQYILTSGVKEHLKHKDWKKAEVIIFTNNSTRDLYTSHLQKIKEKSKHD